MSRGNEKLFEKICPPELFIRIPARILILKCNRFVPVIAFYGPPKVPRFPRLFLREFRGGAVRVDNAFVGNVLLFDFLLPGFDFLNAGFCDHVRALGFVHCLFHFENLRVLFCAGVRATLERGVKQNAAIRQKVIDATCAENNRRIQLLPGCSIASS